MASIFSVSRLIGKSRTRSSKRTSSPKDTRRENEESQSQKRVVVDSVPSGVTAAIPAEHEASKANSRPETLPDEQDISPTPSRKNEVNKNHERKTGALEEPGYDVVLQPSAKASFGEWTELDTGSGTAAKAFEAEGAQFGVDMKAKEEQCLVKTSDGINWTPLDVGEKAGELRMPSVPDWTQLETDKKTEEPSANSPSDAEWLQLDVGKKTKGEKCVLAALSDEEDEGIMSETRVEEERAIHLEEMRIIKEEKEKLAERVKELEEELDQAKHELKLKMEQFVVDLHQKGEEIKTLKEEKEHIQQVAAHEMEESLDEIRQSNEAIAARWQVAQELKDVETAELLAKQNDIQEELDMTIEDLSKSRARVAELESVNELQAKKLLEQDATSAYNDIAVLKGQEANLISQVHTLRTHVQVNERQNSMLMIQLRQQSDDLVRRTETIPGSYAQSASVRRTSGPTVVEQAVRTIKSLNDEIYQTAASLTDCVDEIEKRFVDESDGTAAALETLKSLLGEEIYMELEDERYFMKDEYNLFILQTGFQACLTACCMRIITSWYPAEPEYGKFLEAVYERIRGYGGAENAAQWRKWTLQSCVFSTNTGTKNVLFDFIINNLYAMLSMSGWPKLGETANLLDKFTGKITEVVNLAVRLNTLAAETAMPGDLQTTTVEEGTEYISHSMVKDTPEGEWDTMRCDAPYSEVVVGCVGLGLKWREGDMYEAQLVLKPRVVLRKEYKVQWV